MCKYFSAISNGKGKVLFFKLEDIQKLQQQDNPESYDCNSHTSIAHFNSIKGEQEDKWNKWEYDNYNKKLKLDGDLVAKDDSKQVKKVIEKYLADNNAIYCQKIYLNNSGHRNSGDSNSGHRNSGHSNSGDRNSGHSNSGDWNSGDRNSGYRNSGYRNSGHRNSGDSNSGHSNSGNWNSGDWNSGHSNPGDRNSGHSNSGHSNSGDRNSGDWNSGDWNSGHRNSGYMNSNKPDIRIFNKITSKKLENINFPNYFYFDLTNWVNVSDMTDSDKKEFWWYKTTDGYLRTQTYQESWKKSFNEATKEDVELTLKLPNFNYKIFEEITGITKSIIDKKLK